MKICSHCGGQVEKDDAKFCNLCGEKIEQEQINKFCNKCGNEITDSNVKFCVHCGENFAPKVKKAQRGGLAITGLALAIYNLIVIISQVDHIAKMYIDTSELWVSVILWGIPPILGLIFSIIGAKNCHGALKVIGVIGIVANSIMLLYLLILFISAGATTACVSSQSSSPYDYYY